MQKEDTIYSISLLNNLINKKITSHDEFRNVKIQGEITNLNRRYASGHLYFSLKDKRSEISCVMFKYARRNLKFKPENGMDVIIEGDVSFYKPRGNLQITVKNMEEAGLGELYVAYEELKGKLLKEGLFDLKKPLPKFPKKIGVLTSASGKAIKDIVGNIEKRWPAEILIWNTTVQGAKSTESITENLALANESDVDLIILGRGGGSAQDLWDFNNEEVVRAVANSKKPIITAIGHSTDKTLSDLASDKVAATPTKAAEIAVPNKMEINEKLRNFEIRLNDLMNSKLDNLTHRYNNSRNNNYLKNPLLKYKNKHETLNLLKANADKSMNQLITSNQMLLDGFRSSYLLNNPDYILDKKATKLSLFKDNLSKNIKDLLVSCENKLNLQTKSLKSINLMESFEIKRNNLDLVRNNLDNIMDNKLNSSVNNLLIFKNNHVLTNSCQLLDGKYEQVNEINKSLQNNINRTIENYENKLHILEEKLAVLNPEKLVEKGYVVKDPEVMRKSKIKSIIILIFLVIVIILMILLIFK